MWNFSSPELLHESKLLASLGKKLGFLIPNALNFFSEALSPNRAASRAFVAAAGEACTYAAEV